MMESGCGVVFVLVPFSVSWAMMWGGRHFMTFLMLIELSSLGIILGLVLFCPPEWIHVMTYILVMGASEGALGLAVMVNLSRSEGNDRSALVSLLAVESPKVLSRGKSWWEVSESSKGV